MKKNVLKIGTSIMLLMVPVFLALVSQVGRVQQASAQTGLGTVMPTVMPVTPSTVSICGGITLFTASSTTVPGSITFSTTNVVKTFPILAGVALVNQAAIATTSNVCLGATLDANGNIVSGVITTNNPTTIIVCGPVTAYTAATSSVLGSITIGGIAFPTALGASFTGATAAVGSNLCITAQLSSQGNLISGNAVVNASGAVSLTGPFTTYTAATGTTNGSVTFGATTFVIPAGSNITVGGAVPLSATVAGGHGYGWWMRPQ